MADDKYDFISTNEFTPDRERLIRTFETFRKRSGYTHEQAKDVWSRMSGGRLMLYLQES